MENDGDGGNSGCTLMGWGRILHRHSNVSNRRWRREDGQMDKVIIFGKTDPKAGGRSVDAHASRCS